MQLFEDVLCEGSARRVASEVGHVISGLGSEGAREGKGGSKPCDYWWGVSDSALTSSGLHPLVLIVYEHLRVFPDRWLVSRP